MRLTPYFLLLLPFLLGACKKDDTEDLTIKNRLCTNLLMKSATATNNIIAETERRSSPKVLAAGSTAKRVSSWKNNYFISRSRQDLYSFSDSVLAYYSKIQPRDEVIADGIVKGMKVIQSSDSGAVLNLLYWTLSAELELLDYQAMEVGSSCGFTTSVPTFLNKESFMTKDTVLLAAELNFISDVEYTYDFTKVTWRKAGTRELFTPKTTRIGRVYLFTFIPDSPGRYVVEGNVSIKDYPGMDVALNIYHEFEVN